MKIKNLFSFLLLFSFFVSVNLFSQSRPRLVVGVVIDQMRWDYLYRYYDRYSEDGFKKLLNHGFSFQNTMINYLPSFTAVGHASVYTGSVPSINGIAGNSCIVQKTGEWITSVSDNQVSTIGSDTKKAGEASPKNLRTTTIGDELKLATNFKSKVIGVSLKDRSSILPAGHCADGAFWFDENSGKWITSSFYMKKLPKCLIDYNNSGNTDRYIQTEWNTIFPEDTYIQSVKYPNNYEEEYGDKKTIKFPIDYKKLFKSGKYNYGLLKESPIGNTMTNEIAQILTKEYQLGQDNITDLLAISFSAPDYIGHRYSPNSIKAEDNFLRLDKEIKSLIDFLDNYVGKDEYILFLTADHGASHNAQFMLDKKIDAGVWMADSVMAELNKYLFSIYGEKNIVRSLNNYQVNLNYPIIKDNRQKSKIIKSCIAFFEQQPSIAYAVDINKVASSPIPSTIKERIINGYNREYSGEVQIVLHPQYYSFSSWKGATHGSWNPYDTHIPLLFYGKGIKKGESTKEVYITDIAATLAAILKIQMPSGCIGKPVEF